MSQDDRPYREDSPAWWVDGWISCIAFGMFETAYQGTTRNLRREWAATFARSAVAATYDPDELIEALSDDEVPTAHPLWPLLAEATLATYRPHVPNDGCSVGVRVSEDGQTARVLLLPPIGEAGARVAAELRGLGFDLVRVSADEWHVDRVIPDCPTEATLSISLGFGSQN